MSPRSNHRPSRWLRRTAVYAIAAAAIFAPRAARAQRVDVIHGRVTGPDTLGVQDAIVSVAASSDTTASKVGRTDAKGGFSIAVENGTGSYRVRVTRLGYAPQTRTVTRAADGSMSAQDFKLVQVAAALAAVKSQGARPKPTRSDGFSEFTPGATVSYTDLSGGLSGDPTGDLTSALVTLPGITLTPNAAGGLPSVSAFGVGGDQNSTVLNGISFGGNPPRDGFQLGVVQSTYDPSRGGFAGVQLSLRETPGTNFRRRSLHATLDDPALQWTTPTAEQLGTRYQQGVLSGTASGPIATDRAFYATSFQFTRRASDLQTLLNTDPASLLALRVSPDSASRLLAALSGLGIPTRTSALPDNKLSTIAAFSARLDFTPQTSANAQQTLALQNLFAGVNSTTDDYYVQFGGTVRENDGQQLGPTVVPSAGGTATHKDGYVQLTAAKFLPGAFLNEATASASGADDHSDPYLGAPSARILVASELPDGTLGISSLATGGSGAAPVDTKAAALELRDQLTRYTWDRRHQMALTLDGTFNHYTIDQQAGAGGFAYNSITDFIDNNPASFSRTLSASTRSGSGVTGAVGLGDTYTPATTFRMIYGLRLDANHLGVRPAYNPAVDSVFALRTDHVPNTAALTPMAGFNWQPSFLGQMDFPFAANGKLTRAFITGGVREYRSTISTQSIDSYVRNTGLPGANQQIYCVGDATPAPDWSSYLQSSAAIPDECTGGGAGTALGQTAAPVQLFAPNYQLSTSWRPTATLNYRVARPISLSVASTLAFNRDIAGGYDVNFNGVPRFTLANEGDRPVYVSPTSIVPTTGAVSYTDSRESALFSHVTEIRSDLQQTYKSVTTTLSYSPLIVGGINTTFYNASVGYTYADARERYFGFTGGTAGDPRDELTSLTGGVPRHTFTLNGSIFRNGLGSAQLTARAQSGLLYSPGVSGDINGDGYANDRAFIFDPATTADTAVASAMGKLLASGPANARACLLRQLGTVAGRNSCAGPWVFPTFNLTVRPDAYRLHFGNRGQLSVNFTNVLAGMDQLLHGTDHLHGWGEFAYPDPTLLTVRGFNPTTNQFQYTVNPAFGSTAVYRNTFRAPFVMTIDFRMDVGPDAETQYVAASMHPTAAEKGDSLTLQQIKNKISRGTNWLEPLLQMKDSLTLTSAQIDSITKLSQRYALTRDSIVTDLARYLVDRHGDYSGEEVRRRWHDAGVACYTATVADVSPIESILTAAQKARMQRIPALLSIQTIGSLKPGQIEALLKTPMAQLP